MSIIGSIVNSVTGAVASTTSTLSGTTTAPASSSATDSKSELSTTTSAPASSGTTPAPSSTTSAPASTTSSPTPTPTSSTATPTNAPSATPAPIASTETTAPTTYSSSSSASASDTSAPTTTNTATSSLSSAEAWASALNSESNSMSTLGDSSSSQLHGNQIDADASVGSDTGSEEGEAGVTTIADQGLSTNTIIGLLLGVTGIILLLVLLLVWCFRRKRTQRFSSFSFCGHMSLGATGNLPVFDTRGTERFATSSTSVSFAPFHTAQQESESALKSSRVKQASALWEDEVITAMRIPLEKLTTMALLSSGGYGEVYRGLYHNEPIAMKVLLSERQKDLGHINSFLGEIKIMASIDHPCIVRFIGVAWDSLSDLTAVLEFMEGGDLRSLLKRFEQEHHPCGFDLDKARIALQTAQAVTYLHSLDPNVLHRDLKSRNILLTSKFEAKVSDFGVSRRYSFCSMTAAVGTSLWMAPEVMMGERYDASADIFSFGVVLSELDSHLVPYADARMTRNGQRVPDAALLQLIALGQVRINFSTAAPAALVELGHACVSLDPATRPSASEVHYQLQLLMQAYDVYTL